MTRSSEAKDSSLLLLRRVGERQICCPRNSDGRDERLCHLLEDFFAMIKQMHLQSEIEWGRHGSSGPGLQAIE